MRSGGYLNAREEVAISLHVLFAIIALYKPSQGSLLYPFVKKLPTGQLCCQIYELEVRLSSDFEP